MPETGQQTAAPNTVILCKMGTPQLYGALSGDFCNDWLHVELDEAEMCGDENDVHFMRRFKKNAGITPTEYRILHEIRQNEQQ